MGKAGATKKQRAASNSAAEKKPSAVKKAESKEAAAVEEKAAAAQQGDAANMGLPSEEVARLKVQTKQIEREEAEKENVEEAETSSQEETEPVTPRIKVKVTRKENLPAVKSKSSDAANAYISLKASGKQDKVKRAAGSAKTKKRMSQRGIIYLSHIPHGFYEKQMRKFFTQFGTITNLRLGRSKKTGKSKGYAFVEFQYLEVAKIIAESMNNYLMFNRIMKCELLPKERHSRFIFMGKINPNRPPGMEKRRKAKKVHNSEKTAEVNASRSRRLTKKLGGMKAALARKGINFDIEVS